MPSAIVIATADSRLIHPAPGHRITSVSWEDGDGAHLVEGGLSPFWYMGLGQGALLFGAGFKAGTAVTVTWRDE